ncbi:Hypothetical protein PHPALM_10280 [Phytophthora palmivora]|uniref:Vacuolar protein 8 n=1 Tax=Phytophthora palmivora TaxID=4796 RepID=A0A2P4Y545_9STRA|nr:Hypothetical protein PHPALM_10280 [Phytophthora palmivora]
MDTVLTGFKALTKIAHLWKTIRRQRGVNQKTYLQMMTIYCILSNKDNPTPDNECSKVIRQFETAANHFADYLIKYNSMHRVVRLFKFNDMEEERLQIVAEIDDLSKTMDVVTAMKVMKIETSTIENAANTLAKLENMHEDIRFIHARVQAEFMKTRRVDGKDARNGSQQATSEPGNVDYKASEHSKSVLSSVDHQNNLSDEKMDDIPEEESEFDQHTIPQQQTILTENLPIPLLIALLESAQTTAHIKEQTLLLLIVKCVTTNIRAEVYNNNGVAVLMHLVHTSEDFFTRLYALHCLSWFIHDDNVKDIECEYIALRDDIRVPSHAEVTSLVGELRHEDNKKKEVALVRCLCLSTRGNASTLFNVGITEPLIGLLAKGTANHKLWAAETLGALIGDSDENCSVLVHAGIIPPLISQLRSGTDMQQKVATYTLGRLAAHNEEIRGGIGREGAIPLVVKALKATSDEWSVYALAQLSLNHEANGIAIVEEGAIASLVALLRVGTTSQKERAAYALGNLASNIKHRDDIQVEGSIMLLLHLLDTGTTIQKERAEYALTRLVCGNETIGPVSLIKPLVELIRTGSGSEREYSARIIGKLAASDDERRDEIGRRGAITPLIKLLKTGTDEQKEAAASALNCLANSNEANRFAILEEGALEPLKNLLEFGTEGQKKEAAGALHYLDAVNKVFLPDQLIAPLMGYLRAGVDSQSTNVATALSTLGTVRDRFVPFF